MGFEVCELSFDYGFGAWAGERFILEWSGGSGGGGVEVGERGEMRGCEAWGAEAGETGGDAEGPREEGGHAAIRVAGCGFWWFGAEGGGKR